MVPENQFVPGNGLFSRLEQIVVKFDVVPRPIQDGKLEIEVPRDRTGEFDPQFIRKGQRRFGGFDQKIIAMYAQGMTVREIQRFLQEQYKVEVSADLISTVTDSALEDVVEWQNRRWSRCIRWFSLTP